MVKRLLKPTDELIIGDVLMLRNRFKKKKYALMRVEEIILDKAGKAYYIYCECIDSKGCYWKGAEIGMDLYAHTRHRTATELTYLIPAGRILYGKT